MKFLVTFSFLLIHVVSVFSVYLKNTELDEANLEPLDNIYSPHIPQFLPPLNLTTGELKLFAGYSFKLIKAKCPAVSQERLDLISRYIAKHISRSNPMPGTSPTFKELLTSISTCTEHELTEEERAERDRSFFRFFLRPMQNFQQLLDSADSTEVSTDSPPLETSTVTLLDTIPLNAPSESVQANDGDDKLLPAGRSINNNEDLSVPSVTPDIVVDDDAANKGIIRIFYTATGSTDEYAPWNPVEWLGGVFKAMRNLLSGMFKTDTEAGETSTEIPNQRAKRDVDSGRASKQPIELVQIREPDFNGNAAPAPANPLKGKDAFMALIDNLCRIYCSECNGQSQIRNFKAAAKELLQLIFTDTSGIELAAKHFFEQDFLQTLNDC